MTVERDKWVYELPTEEGHPNQIRKLVTLETPEGIRYIDIRAIGVLAKSKGRLLCKEYRGKREFHKVIAWRDLPLMAKDDIKKPGSRLTVTAINKALEAVGLASHVWHDSPYGCFHLGYEEHLGGTFFTSHSLSKLTLEQWIDKARECAAENQDSEAGRRRPVNRAKRAVNK